MAISLTRVQLATDTVEDLVDACNGNAGTLESAINGIPTYGVVSGGGLSKSGNNFQMVNTGTAGTYGPTANVTGNEGNTIKVPQITTDAKGRVTAVTERTLTCKNTTYSGTSGQISISSGVVSLVNAGTAGTYGPTADVTGNDGSTIKVPQITTDAKGRVTAVTERTLTCKNTNTTYTGTTNQIVISSGAISLADRGTAGTYGPTANVTGSNGATIKVPQITTDAKGRVTAVTERTLTCQNTNTTYSGTSGQITLSGTTFSLASAGTAGTYGPTANVTGSEGNTIKVPQITTDSKGRVTAVTERTLTCKNTTYSNADGSNAGLLSAGTQTIGGVKTFSNTTDSSSTSTGAVKISGGLGVAKNIYGNKVYNAVWNDYAECREAEVQNGGWCVRESKDGIMRVSTGRLQAGCRLTSDTFGQCMGETEKAKTPVAVAGRVLVYPSKRHSMKKWKIGKAVCSSYCGTVDVMNRLECILFPDRIIGYVSEIPDYEVWQAGTKENPHQVFVDGRVWVYVR